MKSPVSVIMTAWMLTAGTLGPASAQILDGAAVFKAACSSCHDAAVASRAPSRDGLRQRSPEAIIETLLTGAMRLQGSRLSGAERRVVAEYLSGRKIGVDVTGAGAGHCAVTPPFPDPCGPQKLYPAENLTGSALSPGGRWPPPPRECDVTERHDDRHAPIGGTETAG